MRKEQAEARDARNPGFFILDNEVLDSYQLSPMALTIYCHLVKWSADKRRKSYISTTGLASRYKKGRATVVAGFKELLDARLVSRSQDRNDQGVFTYTVLQVPKRAVLTQNGGCSEGEQGVFSLGTGGVLTQNTRKKDQRNTKKEDAAGAAHHRLMCRIAELHESATGEKPHINGKDGKALQLLLKKHDADAILGKAETLADLVREGQQGGRGAGFWTEVTAPAISSHWNKIRKPAAGKGEYASVNAQEIRANKKRFQQAIG